MRKLANLFLLLFVISALTNIADQLVQLFSGAHFLSGLHQFAWLVCICSASIVYFGFGFNRHLPKIILLPLFIWLFWALVGHWPLAIIGGDYFQLIAGCGQLLIAILLLRLNLQLNHESPLFTRSQFIGPSFSGQNLLRFGLINILVLPMALLLISYSFVATRSKQIPPGLCSCSQTVCT